MKLLNCCFLTFFIFNTTFLHSQITSQELLEKTISYHDPNNVWSSFNGSLYITMETPNSSKRETAISINLKDDSFKAVATKDSIIKTYSIKKGTCVTSISDSLRIASLKETPKRSHCEMTQFYKNYYTYLYGLPMKLKDPGTVLSEQVERKTFKGKTYLVLKTTYNKPVGGEIWYFYFDPKTYAMEVYQFYKTDANGKVKPKTGEYIILSQESVIEGVKMPKIRAWYYNKNDAYLGTDILNASE